MSDTGESTAATDDGDEALPSPKELEDAAVTAMRECEENSDTAIDGAPRGAVVDTLQDECGIEEEAALQAILDAQMAGRAYMTNGSEHPDQPHVRAPDEPDSNEDPRDDIATSGGRSDVDPREDFPSSAKDLGIPPEEVTPDPPEESQPVEEEKDYILDDEDPGREPEFPGAMSGESIRLRGDEDEEWREPRSLY